MKDFVEVRVRAKIRDNKIIIRAGTRMASKRHMIMLAIEFLDGVLERMGNEELETA
jgi:hypothetical protein